MIEITLKVGELYSTNSIPVQNTDEDVVTFEGDTLISLSEVEGFIGLDCNNYKNRYIFHKDSILKLEIK